MRPVGKTENSVLSWPEPRVLIIGGSSHAGKTTLAAKVASNPGWVMRSTDTLAKHPGKPWKTASSQAPSIIPSHVEAHYRSLEVDELITDVLRHYDSLWPSIASIISNHLGSAKLSDSNSARQHTDSEDIPAVHSLVIEGSALWPSNVLKLQSPHVRAFWLEVSPKVAKERIYENSDYDNVSTEEKYLIDKFLQRTLIFNEKMKAQLAGHESSIISSENSDAYSELIAIAAN